MADKDLRVRRLQWLSARKSAPVSAGGVNTRRLALHRQASKDEEEEEIEPKNECGNLFCRQILANRYARFCEDKPMCQRYRALKLQCLANAQEEEDEEDTWSYPRVIKKKEEEKEKKKKEKEKKKEKKKKEDKSGTFAIPKRKTTKETSSSALRKKGLNFNVSASVANEERKVNSSSPRHKEKVLRKEKKRAMEKRLHEVKEKEKKQRSKRGRKAEKEAVESKGTQTSVISNLSSVQKESASSSDIFGLHTEKKKKSTLPLVRQITETNSDADTGCETSFPSNKRRRVDQQESANNVLALSASSSPTGAASAVDTSRKIHGAKLDQARTSVQLIRRSMSVDLVPLGVANQTNYAGGGRYVQNGNRSGVRPSNPRPRPPSMTRFPAPTQTAPPSALMSNVSSIPRQRTQPRASPQTQRPLPPLPSQASPVPQPTSGAVMPLASPVKTPVIGAIPNSFATTGVPGITRISTTDYMKSKIGDCERRQPGKQTDHRPSRSPSLECFGSLSDDLASGVLPASAYSAGPPGYHRSDSAPLPSYTDSRPAVDPRRQNLEGDRRHQRSNLGIERSRMKYQGGSEICGEFGRSTSEKREICNFPPPRDRYSFRHQEISQTGISNSDNDYPVDTHFDSASSLAEHSYWRGSSHETTPSLQRVPSSRQSEQHVNNNLRNPDHDDLMKDAPIFSHHEDFLPQLLSVFIRKLPQSLEAVFNITKKPRKMNWYITYVKRIEHICKAFELHVKFDGLKANVTVRGRDWLTLQGTSTMSLYLDVIRSLRAEAVTWLRLNEEMETALAYDRGMYGSQVNESFSFLRAWNELKHTGNYISLPRETNYFCGARLHHWNFVVGKVEIGSGSHEEKREAFRLATVSALDFLLSIGRGAGRCAVKRERVMEEVWRSAGGHHRSSSRESSFSNRTCVSPATETENGLSPELPSAGLPSSVEQLLPVTQPPTEQLLMARDRAGTPSPEASGTIKQSATTHRLQLSGGTPSTGDPHTSAEVSTSPITIERTEKVAVVTISKSSHKLAEAGERSISAASNMSASTSARSPRRLIITPPNRPTGSVESAAILAASTSPTKAFLSAAVVSASSIIKETTLPAENEAPTAVLAKTMATFGEHAAAKAIEPATQANALLPPRRCMMCEMIRMRKPNGERCLRCQHNDAPANGIFGP